MPTEVDESAESARHVPLPGVSVVVPVHAGGPALATCLRALAACTPAADEVLVVLDGALAEDAATVRECGVRGIALSPRRGPAAARNLGARQARHAIVFFVDADVALHPDAVARVRAAFSRDDAPAAVIGSYDDAPADPGFLSQYRNLLHHYVHQHGQRQAFTFWGACGAIDASVFHASGGFDERYARPSIEDIELGDRLCRGDHRIELDPALLATHLKAWTVRSLLRTDLCDRAVPWTRLLLARGWPAADLALSMRQRLALASTCLAMTSLALSPLAPPLVGVAAASLGVNVWVQRDLLRFLARRRGLAFAAACLPWLWVYDLISALGLALGLAQHVAGHGARLAVGQGT